MKSLEVGLKKLSLKPGDVLLVQADREFSQHQAAQLKEMLSRELGFEVPIMVVSGSATAKVASEDEAKAVQVALALDPPIPPMFKVTINVDDQASGKIEELRQRLKEQIGVPIPFCFG